jgi:hypothetical protein
MDSTERRNKMKPVFKEDFKNIEDIKRNFEITDDDLKGVKILFAWYGYESYEGSAFILFKKDGKLYEVNGGHCSCYGLEGQWKPEETNKKALIHRIEKGTLGKEGNYEGGNFDNELIEILKHIRIRKEVK